MCMRVSLNWIPLSLAVLIGAFCSVGGVDDISIWVLEFANGISWSDIHKPAPLPPPMQDFVFRPLSVVLMKLTWVISGGALDVPPWLVGTKATLFMAVFGLGVWLWLRQWTTEFWTTVLTGLVMISEPSLFSAFNYSEFDGFGAGLILLSSWLLLNHPSRWVSFAVLSFLVVFLKESSCFIWLCFLGPQLFLQWRDPEFSRDDLQKIFLVIGSMLVLWMIGTSGVLLGKVSSGAGAIGWQQRLPIVQFTLWQITSLWMEGGVILLVLGCLTKGRVVIFSLWFIIATVVPMMVFNHYETRYFSRPIYMNILSIAWLLACFWHMWRSQSNRPFFITTTSCVTLLGLFVVVIMISSNLREDLASRLFLCVLPGMMLICLKVAQYLWRDPKNRWIVCVLVSSQLWGLTIGAWNWGQQIWFENANHASWTGQLINQMLVKQDGPKSLPISVVVTDTSRRYSSTRLQTLAPSQSIKQLDRLHFEPLCYFLSLSDKQWSDRFSRSTGDVYVVHRGRRLDGGETYFQRDFSWIRSPNRGAHMPINSGDDRCTERSLIEDRYDYSVSGSDPLIPYLNSLDTIQLLEVRYYQLPYRLFNIPHMVFAGVPVWQSWQFHQSLYKVPS